MKLLDKFSAYNAKLDGLGSIILALIFLFGLLISIFVVSTVYSVIIGSYLIAFLFSVLALVMLVPFLIVLKISGFIAASATVRSGANMAIKSFKK